MNKKGISPLISTVILLVFAAGIGLVVMNWSNAVAAEAPEFCDARIEQSGDQRSLLDRLDVGAPSPGVADSLHHARNVVDGRFAVDHEGGGRQLGCARTEGGGQGRGGRDGAGHARSVAPDTAVLDAAVSTLKLEFLARDFSRGVAGKGGLRRPKRVLECASIDLRKRASTGSRQGPTNRYRFRDVSA